MARWRLCSPWERLGRVADEEVLVQATWLALRRFRDTPRMLRLSMATRRQVRRSDGALGISLYASPLRREYRTVTAWRDRASLRAFIRSGAHREAVLHFPGIASGRGTFASWTTPATSLPPSWEDVLRRLEDVGPPTRR